ncbi:HNH endonuclease [Desulfocurvibacter africanus PCS]|uniref:HNH endonuclease n=1 Tax=Desulfocurvibacter africanus PCS TaxID=1262666 RepID=M5PQK0_DESAF|nr:HNH endonuclease signature motif containing protein [Desulfocurvibacter africanus]EMG36627.1 HNH endonuclease [Desulfocurvibacter africanus PCS]
MTFTEIICQLSPSHQAALQWFVDHQGQIVSWPEPLPDGTFLVNRPKGIHKPKGWKYALSVRQTLNGPYADQEPEVRSDGSWTYRYYQEQVDPAKRDKQFTNRALLDCQDDNVPVGVLRQVKDKPSARYNVLGVAIVRGWENGFFLFEGFSPNVTFGSFPSNKGDSTADRFLPSNVSDARKWINTSIVRRQGQGKFRFDLLEYYERRCAITGCDVVEALEAAHIVPYLGEQTNVVQNGLLLRADLHTLFDLGLITVDSTTMTLLIAPSLRSSSYADLAGKQLRLPKLSTAWPSKDALDQHRSESKVSL